MDAQQQTVRSIEHFDLRKALMAHEARQNTTGYGYIVARKCGADRHLVQVGEEEYPTFKAAQAHLPNDWAARVRFEYTVLSVAAMKARHQVLKVVAK